MLAATNISADEERHDDSKNVESKRRIDHICTLYNTDMNDSLILLAPVDMAFHKKEKCWDHYYETWMHLVNTYVFMGKVNTGLQEVKKMHLDATERLDKYGQALAYYAMGNAYQNMGYLDESLRKHEFVYPAVGTDHSGVKLTIPELETCCSGAEWVDVCKQPGE